MKYLLFIAIILLYLFFVQRSRRDPWTSISKCLSLVLSVTNFQASDWSKVGVHSVSNFLDCTLYSVQSVVRALTTRELYSLRSTCVLTLNTNSAHNTLRNKIGMNVGIAVVGI